MLEKAGRGTRVRYKNITFRSTWEARLAKALDARGIEWEYEPERFDLGETTYLPDFFLPKTQNYLEVKGWLKDKNQRKIALFREQHPDKPLVVVTKPVLRMFEFSRC